MMTSTSRTFSRKKKRFLQVFLLLFICQFVLLGNTYTQSIPGSLEKAKHLAKHSPDSSNIILDSIIDQISWAEEAALTVEAKLMMSNNLLRLDNAQEALKLRLQTKDSAQIFLPSSEDSLWNQLYFQIGNQRCTSGPLDSCKSTLQEAIAFFKGIKQEGTAYLPYFLNFLGERLVKSSQLEASIPFFKEALEISEDVDNKEELGIACNNLAFVMEKRADPGNAVIYYEKALQVFKPLLGNSHPYIGTVTNNIGMAYRSLGEYQQAVKYIKEGLKLREAINPVDGGVADSYCNLGLINEQLGLEEEVAPAYLKALEIRTQLFGKKSSSVLHVLNLLSSWYLSNDDLQLKKEGLAIRKDMIKTGEEIMGPSHPGMFVYYNNHSFDYFHEKKWKAGMELLQKSIVCKVNEFSDTSLYALPTLAQLDQTNETLRVLENKGHFMTEFYQQSKDLKELHHALRCFNLADSLIQKMRKNIFHSRSKKQIQSRGFTLYTHAIRTTAVLYKATNKPAYLSKIFEFSEKQRAWSLIEQFNASQFADRTKGNKDDLISREEQLYNKLNDLEFALKQAKDSLHIQKIKEEIFDLQHHQTSLIDSLSKTFPAYFHLKHNWSIPSIKEIQSFLKDRQSALISYTPWRDSIFQLTITDKEVNLHVTTGNRTLNGMISSFRDSLSVPGADFYKDGRALYKILLKGLESIPSETQLIILPYLKIHQLPFELLLSEDLPLSERKDYRAYPYIFNKHPFSYAYSTTSLLEFYDSRSSSRNYFLGVSPSYKFESSSLSRQWSPLPGTKHEVEKISELFPSKVLMDQEARKSTFLQLAPKYKVLHLAGHTWIDAENPALSRLVFSDNPSSEDSNHHFLYLHELYQMDLNAELVTLSSCNSGIGKIISGEGAQSLAQGFVFAGCPSLLMSLWPVNDESTSKLMYYWYEGLKKKENKATALRSAKKRFLRDVPQQGTHPYYWGGFVLFGNAKPLSEPVIALWRILLLVLPGIGLGIWVYRRLRSS